jgi:WD40 repeat protein
MNNLLPKKAQRQLTRRTFLVSTGSVVLINSILLGCGSPPSQKNTVLTSPDFTTSTPEAVSPLLFTYRGHTAEVYIVSWSPDSTKLASAGRDQTVRVWAARNGSNSYTYKGHSDRITALDWSHHGDRIVSGSRDSTVQVWIAQTGKHLTTYNGHAAEVLSAAWSPDDNRIVSAGVDTTAQIWDPQTGKPLIRYTGHSDPLNCHKLVT